MNKIILTTILIIIFLVAILGGFYLGIFYQTQKDNKIISENAASVSLATASQKIVSDLKSKDITVDVRGFVKSISGATIILDGKENMPITIKTDTKIYISTQDAKNSIKEIKFSEIKTGYYVNIFITPTASGGWNATKVYASVVSVKK